MKNKGIKVFNNTFTELYVFNPKWIILDKFVQPNKNFWFLSLINNFNFYIPLRIGVAHSLEILLFFFFLGNSCRLVSFVSFEILHTHRSSYPPRFRNAKLWYANVCLSLGKKKDFSFFTYSFPHQGTPSSVNFLLVRDTAESLPRSPTADPPHICWQMKKPSETASLNFGASLPFAKPVFTFP